MEGLDTKFMKKSYVLKCNYETMRFVFLVWRKCMLVSFPCNFK